MDGKNKIISFKQSAIVSLGLELELQIINPEDGSLIPRAKDLLKKARESLFKFRIQPEITQSMIEINSSIHYSPHTLLKEMAQLQEYILEQGKKLDIQLCGGGTHPFQKWNYQKIFPSPRYKNLFKKYRYLSKQFTVFGLHVHVGCQSGEDALYLTHALARYVPQLIAIAAASPFYQGVDTGYASARSNFFHAFPLSGVIPFVTNWNEFSEYFYKMNDYGVIHSMKDFYWDIRPKPEFGTVEIRVCDSPLTIEKGVVIAAYVQALALYLLQVRPIQLSKDLYHLYHYNRFQACRYGLQGQFINAYTHENILIADDILQTVKIIEKYIHRLDSMNYITRLVNDVMNHKNDAATIRHILNEGKSLAEIVKEQCAMWAL